MRTIQNITRGNKVTSLHADSSEFTGGSTVNFPSCALFRILPGAAHYTFCHAHYSEYYQGQHNKLSVMRTIQNITRGSTINFLSCALFRILTGAAHYTLCHAHYSEYYQGQHNKLSVVRTIQNISHAHHSEYYQGQHNKLSVMLTIQNITRCSKVTSLHADSSEFTGGSTVNFPSCALFRILPGAAH
jgi:hypothetical protein